MSTSDRVRAILGGTIQAYRGEPAYQHRPEVFYELDRIGARLNAGPEGQEVIRDEGFDLLAAGVPLRLVSERVLIRDNRNAPFNTQMSEAFLRKRGYRRKDDRIRPDFVQ